MNASRHLSHLVARPTVGLLVGVFEVHAVGDLRHDFLARLVPNAFFAVIGQVDATRDEHLIGHLEEQAGGLGGGVVVAGDGEDDADGVHEDVERIDHTDGISVVKGLTVLLQRVQVRHVVARLVRHVGQLVVRLEPHLENSRLDDVEDLNGHSTLVASNLLQDGIVLDVQVPPVLQLHQGTLVVLVHTQLRARHQRLNGFCGFV